ncbi:aryl-alcohol dehydrogenase [Mrakia frigida]|uniref:aldo/keto reductase n=1 Tax=Mrakia frigida TaxID=29902 RepID=UPI003FCC21E2
MEYVRLGNSGLKVSKIILGTMSYGTPEWQGWVLDEEASLPHFKIAYDAGITTWDTANLYSFGESERVVGKAIKKYNIPRESLVILTKVYFAVEKPLGQSGGLPNQHGLSRKHIFASVDASLDRLGLDYIDLLQCHRFDYDTPIEETMQALHDVVKSGKVRYIGMSSCFAYQFHIMQNYAINNQLTPFISMQNFHNAIYREEEREMFPTAKHFGVGIIPWSPIARGALARGIGSEETVRAQTDNGYKSRGLDRPDASTIEITNRVEAIAKKRGISMAQVAVAWSLAQPGVTAPIIGSTSIKHLEDLIGAVKVKLTEEEIQEISEPYTHRPIIGHA